jgi:hypothetical protein
MNEEMIYDGDLYQLIIFVYYQFKTKFFQIFDLVCFLFRLIQISCL